MTTQEFSNEFDILYNNIMSNKAPGLDEYEKSCFLTKAQEMLILSYYSGRNSTGDSFEKTEEIRRYLDTLVDLHIIMPLDNPSTQTDGYYHNTFALSSDIPKLWFITYESVITKDPNIPCYNKQGKELMVVPTTQDNLYRTLRNPFKCPNNKRVLRLDTGKNTVEIISKYTIDSYEVHYIRQPEPIILTDLSNGLTINGESKESSCKLNPAIHRIILDAAVKLAAASYKE